MISESEDKDKLRSALLAASEKLDEHSIALYLEVPGSQVVMFQAYFETYESIGLVRTLDIRKSLVSVLTTPSYFDACVDLLCSIREEIRWHPAGIPTPELKERFLGYGKGG